MKKLDWKVVRQGETYCAPACGGGCSLVQHAAMKKKAEKMCKELGDGWKPRLTHNMGWFCSVVQGHTTIHYHHATIEFSYSAWIEFEVGGQAHQFINDHKDMKKALAKSVKEAKSLLNQIKRELYFLEV